MEFCRHLTVTAWDLLAHWKKKEKIIENSAFARKLFTSNTFLEFCELLL